MAIGIGLMSGTSLDGLDAVMVEVEGLYTDTKLKVLDSLFCPYPDELRNELLALCSPETADLEKITAMNMYLAQEFAKAVNQLIKQSGVPHEQILFVASHGQTIFHKPLGTGRLADVPGTLQIGDLSVLSELTGLPAVGDFRTADMAAGGQGAPLISFIDYILFRDPDTSRAIQNIGGIGNVTFLPAGVKEDEIISFDTGPGNMVIDAIVSAVTGGAQHYDEDGRIAASGQVNDAFLDELMEHPYFSAAPPKTTGRELFDKRFVEKLMKRAAELGLSDPDLVATVTAWTARTISQSCRAFFDGKLDELIIAGGGSYNPYLLERLRQDLPGTAIKTHDAFGLPSDLKEAAGFAVFGWHTLNGTPNQLPSATGAEHPVIMGKIAYTSKDAFRRLARIGGE